VPGCTDTSAEATSSVGIHVVGQGLLGVGLRIAVEGGGDGQAAAEQ
jgi:hypothetical protein